VISDGLNANAIMDPGHLLPYLTALRAALTAKGFQVAPEHLVVTAGECVRAIASAKCCTPAWHPSIRTAALST